MPIVKNLVTQMSGQIHVESTLGEGTSFVITVPLMPVEETGQKQRDRRRPRRTDSLSRASTSFWWRTM